MTLNSTGRLGISRFGDRRFWLSLFLFSFLAGPIWGQGVLIVTNSSDRIWLPRPVPRPTPSPVSYKIKELSVNARITDQLGQVQVTQSFVNTGSRQMEVSFVFPLPYDGAIDRLTFMVDDKEYEGKLLPAKEARSIYEGYIRRNQDPALLEWMGTGMFKTSVFPVPPGAERKVTLRYSQLLRKDHQLTDFLFPMSTAKYTSKPIEKVSIRATIESSGKIKSVYSPTHEIDVKRPDPKHATIKYEAQNNVPTSDFRLFYDNAKTDLGASLLSYRPEGEKNGFFLLLASPEVKSKQSERPLKTVILVVDRSGSMSGKKMEQAREALKFVLNNLREGDLFNVVAYDSAVESFRPELQKYNDESRQAALGFVEGLYAGGSTNISGALATALEMIQDPDRPNYVVFLTDGRPTAGETNEAQIVKLTSDHNEHRTRLISLGVGYDVNSRLLDRLTAENHGKTEFVRPDEDLEEHVSRLYARISSPVMTDVEVKIDVEGSEIAKGAPVNRVYPRDVPDLFEGEQLVLVGRYRQEGDAKITISGRVGKKRQQIDFPAKLVASSKDESYAFVEKLWAMRRIGEILDEVDLKGKNDELIEELVALSTKHGILTPYTSFLADDQAAPGDLARRDVQIRMTRERLSMLESESGQDGVAQRDFKGALRGARQLLPSSGKAERASADEADRFAGRAPSPAAAGGGLGGFARPGFGASRPAAATPAPAGPAAANAAVFRDAKTDKLVAVDSVRNVGTESIYRRGNVWIASNARNVDLEKQKAEIVVIKRFSDAYFKLVTDNQASENAVMATQQEGEVLVIQLRNKVYRIE